VTRDPHARSAAHEPIEPGSGVPGEDVDAAPGVLDVFRIRPFFLLWLSQAATQIGGTMVIYGLTVIVVESTGSNTAVSLLILTFLVPAVLFSALAGVYVDRVDRRVILVVTNLLRAGAFVVTFLAGGNLLLILGLNIFVSTVTVFFSPAEASMIPTLVPRRMLLAANGVFTLTLNAAFALGFALLGPIVVTIAGAPALLLFVAALYLLAAGFCWTLPSSPPVAREALDLDARQAVADAGEAIDSTINQLRDGLGFIRQHPMIAWSLTYLGIAASLVGVLGVLGPDFAIDALGLAPKDFVVVVLPLGLGIVTGILLLNQFGRVLPRRRVIEGGLVALGILLAFLSIAGPISRFLQGTEVPGGLVDLSAITSLLAVVVLIAYLAGVSYGFVMIPAQTQLQEDLPVDVRGRVFGVLNMLVSVASFLPILIVGPVSDLIGTTTVILLVALLVGFSGIASVVSRGPLRPAEAMAMATPGEPAPADPVAVAIAAELTPDGQPRHPEHSDDGVPPSAGSPGAADRVGTGKDSSVTQDGRIAEAEETARPAAGSADHPVHDEAEHGGPSDDAEVG
jgi:MFS family permease